MILVLIWMTLKFEDFIQLFMALIRSWRNIYVLESLQNFLSRVCVHLSKRNFIVWLWSSLVLLNLELWFSSVFVSFTHHRTTNHAMPTPCVELSEFIFIHISHQSLTIHTKWPRSFLLPFDFAQRPHNSTMVPCMN